MATFNYFLLHFRTRLVEFLSVKPLELLLLSHLVLGSILPLFAEGNHERIDQRCCASFQSVVSMTTFYLSAILSIYLRAKSTVNVKGSAFTQNLNGFYPPKIITPIWLLAQDYKYFIPMKYRPHVLYFLGEWTPVAIILAVFRFELKTWQNCNLIHSNKCQWATTVRDCSHDVL
jgi:hypothetical protein